MKHPITFVISLALLFFGNVGTIGTLGSTHALAQDSAPTDARQRWEQMSEAERADVREKFQHWKSLPSDRRQKLRERYTRFQKLPLERRQELIQKFRKFKSLPKERQAQILNRFEKFRQLPLEEQHRRLEKVRTRREGRATQLSNPSGALPNSAQKGDLWQRQRFRKR
jgi:hypothetical protein